MNFKDRGGIPWVGDIPLEHPDHPAEAAAVFAAKYPPDPRKLYVLFGAGADHRVRAICDAGAVKPAVFEPFGQALLDAYPRDERARYFTSRSELVRYVSGFPGADISLRAPEEYMRAAPEAWKWFEPTMWDAERSRRVRKNTAIHRGALQIENALRNVDAIATYRPAASLNREGAPVCDGATVVCAGAGPSLDKAPLEALRQRAMLFTVSTAGPAVLDRGVRIDVHTSIESLDQSEDLRQTRPGADYFALDLTSHRNNLAAAGEGRTVLFTPVVQGLEPLYELQRSYPLAYGASVATTQVALAMALGAKRIVLVGQDLCYATGQVYATGTGREDFLAEDQGSFVQLKRPDWFYERFAMSGLPRPPDRLSAVRVPGWGGGPDVPVTGDMMLFHQWFEGFAEHYKTHGVELINATGGGAHIPNWQDVAFDDLDLTGRANLHDRYEIGWKPSASTVSDWKKKAIADAEKLAARAEWLAPRALKKPELTEKFGREVAQVRMVDAHAAPRLTQLIEDVTTPVQERQYWVCRIVHESAVRVAAILKGEA